VEQLTRRQLLARGTALALGTVPLVDALAAAAPTSGIFRELDRQLRGDVVQRGAPGYNAARVVYDTRYDAVKPQAIAFCESLADVQRTVRWARKHHVHIVPRSGGHSYGGYSTTSGVIVDVSRLHAVSLASNGRAASGAGAHLLGVYTALANRGRMIPGGTCPTVGIAGLTQGGGIGLSGRKFGLTSDHLLEATVVLADGSAVVANAYAHPDLYWALRGGGGGNFGIVTRFVFRTHPVGSVSTYSLEWPWSDAKQVVQAWQAFAPQATDGLSCVLNVNAVAGSSGPPHITSAGQFFGSEQALRSLLAPLVNAGTPTRFTTTTRTFLQAVHYWAGGSSGRATFGAKSSISTALLSSTGIDALLHQIEDKRTSGTGSGIVLLDSWGGAISRVPKSATAFVHRNALFSMQYLAYWDAGAASAPNLAWLRRCFAALRPHVSTFAYQNYIDPELPNWQHAYYGSNLARLRQIKRKYDPHNVFHFRQSIPPA
jgi:FAD binding domain-containing protein/berberine-like enzyme